MKKKQTSVDAAGMLPAYEGEKPFLFISYRHKNSAFVVDIIKQLRFRDKPYLFWYDEGIPPGSEWPKNVSDHLKASRAVVFFISKEFLEEDAVNCENEVDNAIEQNKDIIVFSIDGSVHPKLKDYPKKVSTLEELISLIPEEFIGDENDYLRSVNNVGGGNIWNILLPVFIGLVLALGVAAYGLSSGWFDDALGRSIPHNVRWSDVAYEDQETTPVIHIDITPIEQSKEMEDFIHSMGLHAPWENVVFENAETKDILYGALGLDSGFKMRYEYIEYNEDVTELSFDNINDEVLGLVGGREGFPYLRYLYIKGGSVSSLEPLNVLPNLRRVYITRAVMESGNIRIPEVNTGKTADSGKRSFLVYIVDD